MSTIKVNRIENTASSSGGINIDASGRVGVDATPEAWSGFSALEVNEASVVSSGSGDAFFTANAYYDGAWKYKDAGVARNIYMNADGIVFRTAASGSADGTITWTEVGRWREGGGLCFNGDTAAANGLDDYEEGDFTPSWGSGLTSPSYATQSGKYTKIGRTVYFTLQISTNGGTANSSAARIDGFPFNAIGTSVTGGAFINYLAGWGIDTPFFYKNQNDATMSIYAQSNGAALAGNAGSGIANVNLYILGFYHI